MSGFIGNDSPSTSGEYGAIKLSGNLSGSADAPTVVDLTISGEQHGSILYFNGTDWVQLSPSTIGKYLQTNGVGANPTWENVLNTGVAIIDFGSAPGSNLTSITVSGQSNISSSSIIKAYINKNSTASHNEMEHQIVGLALAITTGDIVVGSSFTIHACTMLRLTGSFKINWEWR